jgi:hypothetical protein
MLESTFAGIGIHTSTPLPLPSFISIRRQLLQVLQPTLNRRVSADKATTSGLDLKAEADNGWI